MNFRGLLKRNRSKIFSLANEYGVKNIRLFGSVARGDFTPGSDIDFLVTMNRDRSYLDLVGFWQDLAELFPCKIDVITEGGMSPYLKERICSEAIPL